jgi:hypothetical protein
MERWIVGQTDCWKDLENWPSSPLRVTVIVFLPELGLAFADPAKLDGSYGSLSRQIFCNLKNIKVNFN